MKGLSQLLRDIQKARDELATLQKNAPRIIGVEAVRIVKDNFRLQGYDSGNGIDKWPARTVATQAAYNRGRSLNPKTGKLSKYRIGRNSTYKGSVFSAEKPLLEQTMNLYNSLDYKVRGNRVFIGSNLSVIPYAKIHNEGGRGIPQRQYMPLPNQPVNKKMRDVIGGKIKTEQAKAMRNFRK